MKLLPITVFAFLITSTKCHEKSPSNHSGRRARRLVGGTRISPGDHLYMVSLHYIDEFICAGTLIKQGIVLTAAHCLDGKWNYEKLIARLGSYYLNDFGTIFAIDRVILHKNYTRYNFRNDIALLRLKNHTSTKEHFPTVLLYNKRDYSGKDHRATLLGWGTTGPHDSFFADRLEEVDTRILPHAECKNLWKMKMIEISDQICAYSPGKGDCHGDSGGPLLLRGLQVGIISAGSGCGTQNRPTLYTEISSFIRWIEENSLAIAKANLPPIEKYPLSQEDVYFNKIHRGKFAKIREAPFVVPITDKNDNIKCGGAIAGPRLVLTSAECANMPLESLHIRSGTTDLKSGKKPHLLVNSYWHEDYYIDSFKRPVNNIGLIVVDRDFSNKNTEEVKFVEKSGTLNPGDELTIFGWGKIKEQKKVSGNILATSLRSLDLNYMSVKECNASYWDQGGLPKGQFCAFSRVGTCSGDAGGPLMANRTHLIGIQSWTYQECADPRYPTLYTDVSRYVDWIKKKIVEIKLNERELR